MYNFNKKQFKLLLFPVLLLFLLFSGSKIQALAEEAVPSEAHGFSHPDDPYNNALWAFENPGFYSHYYGTFPVTRYSTEHIDMNIWDAWENYPLSKEETRTVTIAIIDTGVDYRHPDLKDQMWTNPNEIPDNGIDDDGNGYVDDIHGWDYYNDDSTVCHYIETASGYTADPDDNDNHGTHIAGIIAATANNGIGISGVASNVNIKIMSLKIHGGLSSSGSVSNAIKAIQYAESMGADICNLSWGTTNYSQALELAIRESSMLFITAAGNNGINNNSTPVFPASLRLQNLISVAYIDCDGLLDSSSNYGVSTVDIAAPGHDIYSTLVGGYGYSNGSSMAAPHITGLAAMIYAYQEYVYPSQVKELIINTMQPLDTLNGYLINPGIPNAGAAIRSLSQISADTSEPFLVLETTYEKENILVHVSAYDAGGSGIRKVRYTYGSKPSEFFADHSGGTAILEDTIYLNKSGYYTFYVEDHAGNYQMYNTYIADDVTPPDYTVFYRVAADYSYISIYFSASDSESGIKTIKYLPGEHSTDAFLFSGAVLKSPQNQHTLYVDPDDGPLTFYVADYRGNSTVCVVKPMIIPATSLFLNVSERSLRVGETFRLQPLIFPWLSTDGVDYNSLNSSVATVNVNGLVSAHKPGEALIQVTAHSGISAVCKFTVVDPNAVPNVPDISDIPVNPDPTIPATGSAIDFNW